MDEQQWKSMNKICPWNYIGKPPYIRCPLYSKRKMIYKTRPPIESKCKNDKCVFYEFIGEE